MQAESPMAVEHRLGTYGEVRAQEDWAWVPRGLRGPAQR